MKHLRVEKCRICGNPGLVPVLDLGVMALTGIFPKKEDGAVPEGPLELVKCHGSAARSCGLLQLAHFFDPQMLFGEGYGYRSGLNEAMRRHLQEIAGSIKRLVSFRPGDTVIDIGSNDGTLLDFFSGENLMLVGVDPAGRFFRRYCSEEIHLVCDFFPFRRSAMPPGVTKAKVVTAIAVFYDIDKPAAFLEEVRDILDDEGVCVLEMGYLPSVLENNAYDTVCHEHAAYYRLKQIKWLADRSGFKIIDCRANPINGGSFCVVLAKKGSAFVEDSSTVQKWLCAEERFSFDTLAPFRAFRENIGRHRESLLQVIEGLLAEGRQIAGYGASTKGNVLLQFCRLTQGEVFCVADVNQDKWGRVCPGTRIPIVSEEEARKRNPDAFLVLPWSFKTAFLEREKDYLQKGGMFLVPLPEVEVLKYQTC